jgi:hypothetical protein
VSGVSVSSDVFKSSILDLEDEVFMAVKSRWDGGTYVSSGEKNIQGFRR